MYASNAPNIYVIWGANTPDSLLMCRHVDVCSATNFANLCVYIAHFELIHVRFKKNNKLFYCFWSGNCASSWIQSWHSRYCFNSLTQLSVHLFPECLHVCSLITWSCNIQVAYRFDMRMWIIFEKWRQSRFFMAFRFISFKSHCWFSLKCWANLKKKTLNYLLHRLSSFFLFIQIWKYCCIQLFHLFCVFYEYCLASKLNSH